MSAVGNNPKNGRWRAARGGRKRPVAALVPPHREDSELQILLRPLSTLRNAAGEKRRLGAPFKMLIKLLQSLKDAGITAWNFVLGNVSKDDWIESQFNPLRFAVAPFLLAGLFSGGIQDSTPKDLCQDSCPHTKAARERVLLPVSDRIYFDNATINPGSRFGEKLELGKRGVTLGPSQKKALEETVQSLGELADCHQKDITVQVAGFASYASFFGVTPKDSNPLNLDASNDRAQDVFAELQKTACKIARISIEEPAQRTCFHRMEADRNKLLDVPDASHSEDVEERIVKLYWPELGPCTSEPREAKEEAAE